MKGLGVTSNTSFILLIGVLLSLSEIALPPPLPDPVQQGNVEGAATKAVPCRVQIKTSDKICNLARTKKSVMTKEEYLSLASEKYEALQTLNTNLNFYDYEKTFDELWTELGRAVLERNIGKIPNDHRKKTISEAGMVKSK